MKLNAKGGNPKQIIRTNWSDNPVQAVGCAHKPSGDEAWPHREHKVLSTEKLLSKRKIRAPSRFHRYHKVGHNC
jgi:hypothetical protein